jgi:hypothetical protein
LQVPPHGRLLDRDHGTIPGSVNAWLPNKTPMGSNFGNRG